MAPNARFWLLVICIATLSTSCGAKVDNPLKPPRVYRGPQVWVTHAPTDVVAMESTPASGTDASATVSPFAVPTSSWTVDDEEQYWVGQIDYLFDQLENRLEHTNVNP